MKTKRYEQKHGRRKLSFVLHIIEYTATRKGFCTHYRKKLSNNWKAQWKHLYSTFWFAGNGLAPTTKNILTLACSVMGETFNLRVTIDNFLFILYEESVPTYLIVMVYMSLDCMDWSKILHVSCSGSPSYMLILRRHKHVISEEDIFTTRRVSRGLNCRPGPCEGVAGAMSASRVACKVVWFIVRQRQLQADICNGDASYEPGASNCRNVGNMSPDS